MPSSPTAVRGCSERFQTRGEMRRRDMVEKYHDDRGASDANRAIGVPVPGSEGDSSLVVFKSSQDIAFDFVALRAVVRSHDASEVMIRYTIASVRCTKVSILQSFQAGQTGSESEGVLPWQDSSRSDAAGHEPRDVRGPRLAELRCGYRDRKERSAALA